jgi:hypothetical protein
MAPRLFGFEFTWNRKNNATPAQQTTQPTGTVLSPVPPPNNDGALSVTYGGAAGAYGYYIDLDGAVVDDFQLINRYREMQFVAEVDEAIDQIINEMVIQDEARMPVSLDLDTVSDLDEETKITIQAEFDGLLKQLNFHKDAYTIMRQWYIDGRLFYHLLADEEQPEKGIQELRIVDPRCIKKIREVTRKRHDETQADIIEVVNEYYAFNPMGYVQPNMAQGTTMQASMLQYAQIRLTLDSVAYVPSGLYDTAKRTVLSWMHKAIKPLNLLRMMEDSCVIYRVARAPERRVFYIDVGNLPKQKAEQYLYDIMQKYRNKLVYDVNTGDVRDDRKFMSIMEDYWLPRKEGGKGTEIVTLPAGQNLSEMEDVDYFRRKLYRALNIPPSRIDPGAGFNLGKASEISRDELRFTKFIHRLQTQFSSLFDTLLERQLRMKNIMTEAEWHQVKDNIKYVWQQDSYFEELKTQEMWTSRLNLLTQMEPYINKFFSSPWIRRNILKFTDDQWEAIREEFDESPSLFGQDELNPDGALKDPDEMGEIGNEDDSPFIDDDEADGILADGEDDPDSKFGTPDDKPVLQKTAKSVDKTVGKKLPPPKESGKPKKKAF